MDRRSQARVTLCLLLGACWLLVTLVRPAATERAWWVRLEVAQVRLSVAVSDAPVRERTVVSEIEQLLKAAGWR